MYNTRKIGFEIEYNGVDLKTSAQIIQSVYGGEINCISHNKYIVKNTKFGDFEVELDVEFVQKLDETSNDNSFIDTVINEKAEKFLGVIAPNEIVCPPIKEADIIELDSLRLALHDAGAKGTAGSFMYAYGLHINAELEEISSEYILSIVKSYIELSERLKSKTDISRVLTGFIKDYPNSYKKLVMDSSYNPNMEVLIQDYLKFNPTRNRALDLLPLFKYIDKNSVKEIEDDKIKARPAFHYRLPNCKIGEKNWSLFREWNRWREVEENAKKYRRENDKGSEKNINYKTQ